MQGQKEVQEVYFGAAPDLKIKRTSADLAVLLNVIIEVFKWVGSYL